jgi:hypothetical protein
MQSKSVRLPVSWLVAALFAAIAAGALAGGTASATHQLQLQTVTKKVQSARNHSSAIGFATCPNGYKVVGGGGQSESFTGAVPVLVGTGVSNSHMSWYYWILNSSTSGDVRATAQVVCARLH